MLKFEWDSTKDTINKKKHGISFAETMNVFYDENALLIDDPMHSEDEDRYILLGIGAKGDILTVVHCYRKNDEVIRIISARKSTKNECLAYEKGIDYEKRIRLH